MSVIKKSHPTKLSLRPTGLHLIQSQTSWQTLCLSISFNVVWQRHNIPGGHWWRFKSRRFTTNPELTNTPLSLVDGTDIRMWGPCALFPEIPECHSWKCHPFWMFVDMTLLDIFGSKVKLSQRIAICLGHQLITWRMDYTVVILISKTALLTWKSATKLAFKNCHIRSDTLIGR